VDELRFDPFDPPDLSAWLVRSKSESLLRSTPIALWRSQRASELVGRRLTGLHRDQKLTGRAAQPELVFPRDENLVTPIR
jgi:hypothetical protein